MSQLLCCLRARSGAPDMGAALSHPQEGEACEGVPAAPPTMADVIRERKKKAGGAGLGTLRRRIAAAARRPRDARPDRGCEHARFIRSVVSPWRLAEVFLLSAELEAGAALRDLATQAALAREPAPALHQDLASCYRDRWWCDVEIVGCGWALRAHRPILAARSPYFRDLLRRYPSGPHGCRVPLEGLAAGASRADAAACLRLLYGGGPAQACPACDGCQQDKWDHPHPEGELDILSTDSGCACGGGAGGGRLAALIGLAPERLHQDLKYLLDSGEWCDSRLVFLPEGEAAPAYGFAALDLPTHRAVLAARSRFFRSMMSRRGGGGGGGGAGAVCVDEKVLPRRFARALLHAAYTDQVDLSLIGRASSSPSATGSSTNSGWAGVSLGARTPRASPQALEDAFQLYEIARFLEMPIVVQGCEDAILGALSADSLPAVLRWAAQPHASQWVHRQAMRYLLDEFPSVMMCNGAGRVPRAALAAALESPFLQASEPQALRGLLRWAERGLASAAAPDAAPSPDFREPNVVWHTSHSLTGAGGPGAAGPAGGRRVRRGAADLALRDALAPLLPLIRTEHLPRDHDLLQQMFRRGLATPGSLPAVPLEGSTADAWLARGSYRPPRCFLPYLDEIKALVEGQALPAAELARARRQRYLHRIPDTLYMVSAARCAPAPSAAPARAAVAPRLAAAVRARAQELRATAVAQRALALHAHDTAPVHRQIALRAVRELSLPDECADLALPEPGETRDREGSWGSTERLERDSTRGSRERERDGASWPAGLEIGAECCRAGAALARCPSAASRTNSDHDSTSSRREPPRADVALHRSVWDSCSRVGAGAGTGGGGPAGPGSAGALSLQVPDVAMAPNANTHLLTDDYYHHARHHYPAARHSEYGLPGGACAAGVGAAVGGLQLDLGDGATHTPRPGSRAVRERAALARQREGPPPAPVVPVAPTRHPPAILLPGTHGHGHGHSVASGSGVSSVSSVSGVSGVTGASSVSSASGARQLNEEELRAAIDLTVIRAYNAFHSSPSGANAANGPGPGARRPRPRPPGRTATLPHCYRQPQHQHTQIPASGTLRALRSPGGASRSPAGSRHSLVLHTPVRRLTSTELRVPPAGSSGGSGGSAGGAATGRDSPSPSHSPRRSRQDYLYRHHDYRLEGGGGGGGSGYGSRGPSPGGYA